MSYKALYRTYRPSTFEQVAGQQHIVRTLSNALKENKIAHAYLFCGPRGTGKTSMARLFAKSLNCEEGFGHQCNNCPNCQAIIEGSHPDVIEIDAARNRGIDDIRDLIGKVKYSPALGKYKVYIIDEVHMMTTEAFNALLKTLEEPPSNVVFILATTEPYKLMPTILSRVQRYDFNKVSDNDLLGNLKMICSKEHIEANEEALKLIVSLADGGVRDSLSMLDQAIAYSGNKLELHHVEELYGLTTTEEKIGILNALVNGNVKFFTEKLEQLINHGTDIKRLTIDLIDIVKDLLIYNNTKDSSILKILKENDANSISISKKILTSILDILVDTYSQYRFVSNVNSLLEIAFLKISNLHDESGDTNQPQQEPKVIVKEVVKEIVKEVPVVTPSKPIVSQPIVEAPKEDAKPEIKPMAQSKPQINVSTFVDDGETYSLSEEDTINLMLQGNKVEKQKIIELWPSLSDYLGDPNTGTYANLLKQCSPRIVAKDVLVLESKFVNVTRKINIISNQDGLSKLVQSITGKSYIITCLSSQDCISRVTKFTNLRQANKLPTPYPINIKISNNNSSQNLNNGRTNTELLAEEFKS